MRPLRITIVTFAWPPRNSIGAHRPLSWARYWSEAGARVRVLTAQKYSYDEPRDLPVPELPGVEVIEVDYATGSTSLAAAVLSGPFGHLARKLYRLLRRGPTPVRNPREKWLNTAMNLVSDLATDTDAVVSTYDPRAVHQIAAAMKEANPELIWVADYRDLWSLNHATDWTDEQRAKERALEKSTVVALADMVCSISDELSRQQGEFANKEWLSVTNGFDVNLQDVEEALTVRNPNLRKPITIVYTGKLYQGLRDPSPLFQVILDMERTGEIAKGDVAVHIYGGQVDGLGSIMNSGLYDHFVTLHGHVSRDTALKAQRSADLLLLLESPLPEARGVLTGKIFEYMSSAVPIVSLGSRRDSAIGQVLAKTATGTCSEDDPARIRDALRTVLAGETPEWFTPDLSEIGTYSRAAQADKLLKRITELCGRKAT